MTNSLMPREAAELTYKQLEYWRKMTNYENLIARLRSDLLHGRPNAEVINTLLAQQREIDRLKDNWTGAADTCSRLHKELEEEKIDNEMLKETIKNQREELARAMRLVLKVSAALSDYESQSHFDAVMRQEKRDE